VNIYSIGNKGNKNHPNSFLTRISLTFSARTQIFLCFLFSGSPAIDQRIEAGFVLFVQQLNNNF
jgi:hypothetical protein